VVAETMTVLAPEDFSLASRCAAGDRAAQRRLFNEHRGRAHAILYRLLGSNRDMEDLVQEAFIEIFRSLGRYRGEAKLGTWIDRVTTRVAYAYFKRKRPASVRLESVPDVAADDPGAERRVLAREAARRLYAILDRLDTKYRIAFALHVVDGRPLREVAEITESSLVATKSRVWRARREVNRRARKDPVLSSFLQRSAGREGEVGR
jgi:RNA polymerase sigma-70 factor (ECF subfamily)